MFGQTAAVLSLEHDDVVAEEAPLGSGFQIEE